MGTHLANMVIFLLMANCTSSLDWSLSANVPSNIFKVELRNTSLARLEASATLSTSSS